METPATRCALGGLTLNVGKWDALELDHPGVSGEDRMEPIWYRCVTQDGPPIGRSDVTLRLARRQIHDLASGDPERMSR